MKSSPLLIKGISVLLVLFGIYACSHQIPQPQDPTSQVTQVTPITTAQREAAEIWFLVASNLKPIHVDWDKASVVGDVVVAPLADKSNPFASKDKQGYRYVVAKLGSNDKAAGRIVELVLDGQKRSPEEAIRLAAEAVRPVIAGGPAATLPGVSGWVILYSSAYQYEAGYVYKAGALQQERVTLTASSGNAGNKSGQAKTTQIQYITVTTCGYVNGQLSNCITDTYAIDTGDGGGGGGGGTGGDGGGGGGGGGSTGNNWGGVGGVQSPVAEDGPLTIGDHSKVMTYKYDETTDLKVLVEWSQNPPVVDKVSLAVVGLTAATTLIPFGNGTATIFTDKFGPGQDLIRFQAYFQFQAGTGATGPIANGTIFLLSGNLNTGTGVYNVNLQKR